MMTTFLVLQGSKAVIQSYIIVVFEVVGNWRHFVLLTESTVSLSSERTMYISRLDSLCSQEVHVKIFYIYKFVMRNIIKKPLAQKRKNRSLGKAASIFRVFISTLI